MGQCSQKGGIPIEKASLHKGKLGTERHNERDFNYVRLAEHIDPAKTHLNVYKSYCPGNGSELAYYEQNYRASLDAQNARYARKYNYDRIRSMEEVYRTKQKSPTEEIIQFSHHGGVDIPKSKYDEIVDDYIFKLNNWSQQHGNHFHVLKYSTHYDEQKSGHTHTHIRTIWDYVDNDGNISIGQEKGMEQAGLSLPNPSKKVSKWNNRCITWTALQREMWEDTLIEHGYAVDKERAPKVKHQSKKEHEEKMHKAELEIQANLKASEASRKEYERLRANQAKLIQHEANVLFRKLYDSTKAQAKQDAQREAEKEFTVLRSRISKAKQELETTLQQKKAVEVHISKNKAILDEIASNKSILANQSAKIAQNEARLQRLSQQTQVLNTAEQIDERSRYQAQKYGGNISKFLE